MNNSIEPGCIQVTRGGKNNKMEFKKVPHLITPKDAKKYYVLKNGMWTDIEPLLTTLKDDVSSTKVMMDKELRTVKTELNKKAFLGLHEQLPPMEDGNFFISKGVFQLGEQTVNKGDTVYRQNGQYVIDRKIEDVLSNVDIDPSVFEQNIPLFLYYDPIKKTWSAMNQMEIKQALGLSILSSLRQVPVELGGTGLTEIQHGHILVGDETGHLKQVPYIGRTEERFFSSKLEERCVAEAVTVLDDDKILKEPKNNEDGVVFKVLALESNRTVEISGSKVTIKKNREYSFISYKNKWINFKCI